MHLTCFKLIFINFQILIDSFQVTSRTKDISDKLTVKRHNCQAFTHETIKLRT